jgi:diaminohydroxyphosphoribosylaminopyrimidine deaminase/5-amino-6-(5-phosphoribosylamino)uracil reductase
VFRVEAKDNRLDLKAVLNALGARGITRLMVEGGPTVAAAFVQAGLVDQAALFHSPDPIGDDGIGALEGLPLAALTGSPALKLAGSETIGPDRLDLFEKA